MAPADEKMNATSEEQVQMLDVHEKDNDELLPSPVSATSPRPSASKPKLSAAAIIPIWIVLSSAVIIYNNYLYNTLEFRFPVFLVTWHLTFAVSLARSLSAPCATCEELLRGQTRPRASRRNGGEISRPPQTSGLHLEHVLFSHRVLCGL